MGGNVIIVVTELFFFFFILWLLHLHLISIFHERSIPPYELQRIIGKSSNELNSCSHLFASPLLYLLLSCTASQVSLVRWDLLENLLQLQVLQPSVWLKKSKNFWLWSFLSQCDSENKVIVCQKLSRRID